MRHRKKLIAAFLAIVGGLVAWHFWPRDRTVALALLDQLRTVLESEQCNTQPSPTISKVDADAQFEVDVIVAKVDMTDATRGLFANSTNARGVRIVDLTSKQQITDLLRRLCSAQSANIVAEPCLAVMPQQSASVAVGSQVPFPIKTLAPALPYIYRNVGVNVGVTAKAASSGRVELELECELSCINTATFETPQGPIKEPVLNSRKWATTVILGEQETLLIGKLTQKGTLPVTFKAPLLSDLAGIGPMFSFSWQRPIDEELIVLATPRVVHPSQR